MTFFLLLVYSLIVYYLYYLIVLVVWWGVISKSIYNTLNNKYDCQDIYHDIY